MSSGIAFSVLLAIDLGAVFVAFWLAKHEDRSDPSDAVPLSVLLPVIGGAVLAHLLGTGLLASTVDLTTRSGRLVVVGGSALCGFVPTVMFAWMMTKTLSNATVNHLYGMKTARRQETDCTGARAAYHRGDVDEALQVYRRLFRENPHNAAPLLEANRILKEEGRHDERVEMLRDLLAKCKDDVPSWAEAAFAMADLQEHHLGDQRCADAIRREILKRAPKSDYGKMAREILMKRQPLDSN